MCIGDEKTDPERIARGVFCTVIDDQRTPASTASLVVVRDEVSDGPGDLDARSGDLQTGAYGQSGEPR